MRSLLPLLALGFASAVLAAEPPAWPQFRGHGGTGVAPKDARPPVRIGPDTNVQWKVPVPPGVSSPVIAGSRLFLTGYERGKLVTLAYARADGALVWRNEAPVEQPEPFEKKTGSPAASTPATDGERLVVYFGSYGLLCYDLAGKELWRRPLKAGQTQHGFGTGSSPVLADGRVVLLRDLEADGELLCLDLVTGKRLWQADRAGCRTSWGSPCVWDTPAGEQVVVVGGVRLTGYDLKSGQEVWTVKGLPSYPVTTPVTADGHLVYAGWSYGADPNPDPESRDPTFNELLKQAGEERLGHLTSAGWQKTKIEASFDEVDLNKDGKLTRQEWDKVTDIAYKTSGRNLAFSVPPGRTGLVTDEQLTWTMTDRKGLPYIPSPLVYQGLMYTVSNSDRLSAYDVKTGKEVYVARNVGLGKVFASPVAAAGHVYLCCDNAAVVVVRAGPAPQKVWSDRLDDRITATPAIAGNTLYIRTNQTLYAFAGE